MNPPAADSKATQSQAAAAAAAAKQKKDIGKQKQQDIRVSTQKLDQLNDLMGELVTAKTMILANIANVKKEEDETLEKAMNFLGKTINDLQDVAVDIRMIPISGLFKKMIRIVHDLSRKSSKKVNLNFFGEDTEIDKTLVEKISDPLVHMIRNSVDHGLESEDDRIATGKAAIGTVTLGAKQEAGEIWVIVEDDGKGLDRSRIIEKAKKNNLIDGDGSDLSDQEVFKFIYSAGFSTAEKVTDVSGRGVGMDVVAQNIAALRGNIDIFSTPGKGTKFIIKLPLTLAIIDGMLLEVGSVKYTLPIENIQEIVKVEKKEIESILVEHECIDIRGKLISVVSLSHLHNLVSTVKNTEEGILIIINNKGQTIALLVDKIVGQHQTVVKPLSKYFKKVSGVSSCSVLGDGEVSLILDAGQLIDVANSA